MQTVRIKMTGCVIGEDRGDWVTDEVHECSPHFARHLVHRGLAHILESERAFTPGIEHGDPSPESRDPGMSTETAAPIVAAGRRRR